MDLVLLPDATASALSSRYRYAFTQAVELYVVSAYLTHWAPPVSLPASCEIFSIIVGSDFGLTKKAACEAVMAWLPARFRHRFLVADDISGFHPKAVFWRDGDGVFHALVGSSNLSRAAFSKNHEANMYTTLTRSQFDAVRTWVAAIEKDSVSCSPEWLEDYEEAPPPKPRKRTKSAKSRSGVPVLPNVPDEAVLLKARRAQMKAYEASRPALERLFRQCAAKALTNIQFYEALRDVWGYEHENRLQGSGWERTGKSADFRQLSTSFVRILDAKSFERDDVVVQELDRLEHLRVPARGAFLSEMLCLRFPELYPVLNKPVALFKRANGFRAPWGASTGSKYLSFALWLRTFVSKSNDVSAENIAELDHLIWGAYGRKNRTIA